MKNYFSKNILVLSVMGFLSIALKVSAESVSRYLSADLGAADLMETALRHPNLVYLALAILIVLCLIYVMRYFLKKK